MFGNFIYNISNALYRYKLLFSVLFIGCIVFLYFGVRNLRITENIFSVLPQGEAVEQYSKILANKNFNNKVLFALENPSGKLSEKTDSLLNDFSGSLGTTGGEMLGNIVARRPDLTAALYNYYYHHYPYLIDSSEYGSMESGVKADAIRESMGTAYQRLTSPGSSFLRNFILKDPLYLTSGFFQDLQEQNRESLEVEDGILLSDDKRQIIVTAETRFDAGDSEKNIELYRRLESFKTSWNNAYPGHGLSYFGTFQIAAENALQVKEDTSFTVTVTVVLILLILFIAYRRFLIPVLFILPGLAGAFFAMGVMGYVSPEVSGISLATSAVLFGIILDYSFHFFTHLRDAGSLEKTIKEISTPLLTGSFTTITAFSALMFTNSPVLRDFGKIAGLSLSGAVLFTLLVLPVILRFLPASYSRIPKSGVFSRVSLLSGKRHRLILPVIILVSAVLLYFAQDIEFDSDPESLSIHSEKLKKQEESLTGVNPEKEKKVFLFLSDSSREKAAISNYRLYQKLKDLHAKGRVKSFTSVAPYRLPEEVMERKGERWKAFWKDKKEKTVSRTFETADSLGFDTSAFAGFTGWLELDKSVSELPEGDTLINALGLNDLISENEKGITYISTMMVAKTDADSVKNILRMVPGVEVFDRGEKVGGFLELVKEDFNYILYVSAIIVFISLLIIYGRIEMTLFTFLPMLISWVWILGIVALLDIHFNFVNVVIATFIFGLGDDFSIFITSGLVNRYKYKDNRIKSYSSAIMLSALTTILGTGVLYFAEHPAIRSVSAVSVLGILCIVFISFLFQPLLFRSFIEKRAEKKRAPMAFMPFLISVIKFFNFALGCIVINVPFSFIALLPLSKTRKRAVINRIISGFSRFIIYGGVHVRKKVRGIENIKPGKPSILIANHTSFLDILLVLMLNRKIIIVVKDWVYKNPLFGHWIRYAGYVYTEKGMEKNYKIIKQRLREGYSILIFPEGTRSRTGKINRFHKGAFFLAEELKLDITPVLISGASHVLPKGSYYVNTGSLDLKILPSIPYEDRSWGETYRKRTKTVSRFFKEEHAKFECELKDNNRIMWPLIYGNYIYKSPVLEWYLRVKWKFEAGNYQHYDQLIGDRKKILDIGCGYGFLTLFLYYKDKERDITGIDYDAEKVELAGQCYGADGIEYVSTDALEFQPDNYEAIFLNDVLHYMSGEKQLKLLEKCCHSLEEDGMILIRDGIIRLENRHKFTEVTEFFSTKLLGFNKTKEKLNFFGPEFIRKFAEKNRLTCEMIEQSERTSNVLFILRKLSS